MKKIICFLLSTLMIFSLSACGEKPTTSTVADTSSTAEMPKAETVTLYIGIGEGIKEVPCTVEKTPEAVIAALAAETGWNLSLKSVTANQPEKGCLTVALARESSIYSDPPTPQKEVYHVFDAQDWVYTVLNSVAVTLNRNFEIGGVAFASPEGGDIEAGNEFIKFKFNSKTLWDYESISQTSDPESVSTATTLIRKMMEARGEKGAVILENGEETIDGERCLTFSVGDNSADGQKFTASYQYAVSDTKKVWTIDVMSGPDWVLLDAF